MASGTPDNTIRVTTGSVWNITSMATLPVGINVCKWGWKTKNTCGTTTSAPAECLLDPEDGVSHYCNMIAVSPFSFADHGDSGGPVYAGQRAYATITGPIALAIECS